MVRNSIGITCCFLLQEMERTAHMFETFLWTSPDEWFTLSNLLPMSSLLSHSLSNCTNYAQSLGVKCSLTHSFSVEFGAIVSGTWNQPAYKNQTKLQKHVVFSTNKKYNPTAWRFWCYRNCFRSAPLFCTLGDSLRMQTSKPEETEWGSCNCAELLKTMGDLLACLFVFPLFYPTLIHTLGNGLKPVLELAIVYSGEQLKKLGETRLDSLELPLMCLFIHLRRMKINRWAHV